MKEINILNDLLKETKKEYTKLNIYSSEYANFLSGKIKGIEDSIDTMRKYDKEVTSDAINTAKTLVQYKPIKFTIGYVSSVVRTKEEIDKMVSKLDNISGRITGPAAITFSSPESWSESLEIKYNY